MGKAKDSHEIRDPIHVFIRLESDERMALDSRPIQRLRHIHQLGTTFTVYPAATHRRFQHSLGTMALADQVFRVITNDGKLSEDAKVAFPELRNDRKWEYWLQVLRMAALCHDVGHLPFSHSAEGLLPEGWDHERLTAEIIRGPEMTGIWQAMTPPLEPDLVARVAVGPKKARTQMSPWETLLSEIIVGDAFGVDRMDYLL